LNLKVARTLQLLAVLLLLALAWLGVKGGIEQWPASQSVGQKTQTAAQSGSFSRVVRLCWLVTLTFAGGLAPSVWGGASWAAGLVAGLGACAVAVLVLWLLGRGVRGLTSA
jgi:hypothetical protein